MSERYTMTLDEVIQEHETMQDSSWSLVIGRCVVANGCFDILHPGHLSLLASLDTIAYQMKLRPIVALNSDKSIREIKGPGRPIIPEESRAKLLNSLKWPFTVVIFDEPSPQRLMDFLRPVIVVKGGEYSPESVVRWNGSGVITVEMVRGWSTSGIVGDTR